MHSPKKDNPKHIVIVAGEESGDRHGADLARQLYAKYPALKITGIGGQHMEQAHVELISDLARFGVTGLIEVLRHLRTIKKALQRIKQHLELTKPDLLILVDYPGFNLTLAKFAKQKLNLRIVYYISPQIWAWKANRIKTIQKNIDRMAVILPFEKPLYQNANVPVSFVGHPLIEKRPYSNDIALTRQHLNLPLTKRLIALLPGSRTHEIDKHMPVLVKTAERLSQQHPDLHFVIPIATTLNPHHVTHFFKGSPVDISFIQDKAFDVMSCSDCVVVASGTASLECALLEKPMCIIYKGSWLSYIAAMKFIKVKYLGLCNVLENRMIVPELLQYDYNPHELARQVNQLLSNKAVIQPMRHRLKQLKSSLSLEQADCTISELVMQELEGSAPHPNPLPSGERG